MELSEIKRYMHKAVTYDGNEYKLKQCVLWLDENKGKFRYSLVLADKSGYHTVTAPMEKVKPY